MPSSSDRCRPSSTKRYGWPSFVSIILSFLFDILRKTECSETYRLVSIVHWKLDIAHRDGRSGYSCEAESKAIAPFNRFELVVNSAKTTLKNRPASPDPGILSSQISQGQNQGIARVLREEQSCDH